MRARVHGVMSMQIKSSENIAALFSIFHDAYINSYEFDHSNLKLDLECQYLAEKIDSSFRRFEVIINQVKGIVFETWPDDHGAKPDLLTDLELIFFGDLEILNGETKKGFTHIALNQSKANLGYCGGVLKFQASSAIVNDQAGNKYSFTQLENLAQEYWQEWKQKNKT